MLIQIKAKPSSKQNKIILKEDNVYHVNLTEPPVKGKANKQLIKLLSDYFSVSKFDINIKKGLTQRNKIIEIHNVDKNKFIQNAKQTSLSFKDKKKTYLGKVHCWDR